MYMQLLLRWAMNVYGVGSAHNRATYLTYHGPDCVEFEFLNLEPMSHINALLTTLKTLQLDMVSNYASPF